MTTRSITVLCLLTLSAACGPPRTNFHGDHAGVQVIDPPDVHLEGDHITIDERIHFAHDSDEILADSSQILDHLAQFLENHPELTALHVVGHTDASGGAEYNQDLSERRAAAVRAALTERGVRQSIDSRGAGMSEPLCSEDTDECHAQNRRVEFRVEQGS